MRPHKQNVVRLPHGARARKLGSRVGKLRQRHATSRDTADARGTCSITSRTEHSAPSPTPLHPLLPSFVGYHSFSGYHSFFAYWRAPNIVLPTRTLVLPNSICTESAMQPPTLLGYSCAVPRLHSLLTCPLTAPNPPQLHPSPGPRAREVPQGAAASESSSPWMSTRGRHHPSSCAWVRTRKSG